MAHAQPAIDIHVEKNLVAEIQRLKELNARLREGMGYYRQLAIGAMKRANEKWDKPIYDIERIMLDSIEDDLQLMRAR